MPDNIPIVLWILIVFAVSHCVPSGVSYRELQAVAFYDRSYDLAVVQVPTEGDKNKTNPAKVRTIKGWWRRRLHDYFFTGTLASSIFAALFTAWVLFWYYHQTTKWYDVIMAMSTLFFGLLKGLPWVFVVTDDNYDDHMWFRIAKLEATTAEARKKLSESTDPDAIVRAKRLLFWYSVLLTVIAGIIVILVAVNKNNIDGWTFYVSVSLYAVCVVLMLFVNGFFLDVLWTAKETRRSKAVIAPLPTTV